MAPFTFEIIDPRAATTDWRSFRAGQARAYARYQVSHAKTLAETCDASLVWGVAARTRGGRMVGGLKCHLRGHHTRLPLEGALVRCHQAGQISRFAQLPVVVGMTELSGTWVDEAVAGLGLARRLVRHAVAHLTGPWACVGFGHQKVLPLYRSFGFEPVAGFPTIPYPNARYQSTVCMLPDPHRLSAVPIAERLAILDLRERATTAVWSMRAGL